MSQHTSHFSLTSSSVHTCTTLHATSILNFCITSQPSWNTMLTSKPQWRSKPSCCCIGRQPRQCVLFSFSSCLLCYFSSQCDLRLPPACFAELDSVDLASGRLLLERLSGLGIDSMKLFTVASKMGLSSTVRMLQSLAATHWPLAGGFLAQSMGCHVIYLGFVMCTTFCYACVHNVFLLLLLICFTILLLLLYSIGVLLRPIVFCSIPSLQSPRHYS